MIGQICGRLGPCRRRPRASRARTRHSGRVQSRGRRCLPEPVEGPHSRYLRKAFSTYAGGVWWSPWPSNWPALAPITADGRMTSVCSPMTPETFFIGLMPLGSLFVTRLNCLSHAAQCLSVQLRLATKSISTRAPLASPLTPTQVRAGRRPAGK